MREESFLEPEAEQGLQEGEEGERQIRGWLVGSWRGWVGRGHEERLWWVLLSSSPEADSEEKGRAGGSGTRGGKIERVGGCGCFLSSSNQGSVSSGWRDSGFFLLIEV